MNAKKMLARYAQGGMVDESVDVSKARQMLQNLSSPVQHFASGSEVVPAGFRRSLFTGELVPIAATVEQLTDIYRGGEAQQANADAAAKAIAAAETPVQASPAVSAAPASAPDTRLSLFTNEPVPVNASVQDLTDIYSDYSFPSEPPAPDTRLSLFTNEPVPVNASVQDLTNIYSDYSFPSEPAVSTVTASPSTVTASPSVVAQDIAALSLGEKQPSTAASDLLDLSKVVSPPPSNLSEGLQYATDEGGIGAAKYYENIRNFVNTQGPDLSAAEVRAEMNKYGVSDKDVRDALAGTQYSGAAVHALLNPDIGAADAPGRGVGGLEGMSANIRDYIQDQVAAKMTREQLGNVLTQQMGAYNPETGVGGFNEQDLIRATGKTASQLLNDLYGVNQKPPPVATTVTGGQGNDLLFQSPPDLPPLTDIFVPPTAPPPSAPPPALTPGQEGLDPSTAIVGAIPQSERVTIPQLDTEFRASAPRTPTYDRFGRITGYNYSPAAKLTPATGTNVFNFVPPGITSRPRSLLNIGDVPGVTIDPVTGQFTLGLSASQRFARDRAELDNQFRRLYARAAEADTSLPTQAPGTAAAAFRNFAMSDPTMSAQLRMRDIEQTPTVSPTAAMVAARSEYGATPYAAALTAAFDPFLARNRASLLASKDMQKSYFERYPDLVAEYEKNWSKTMSPEEYAAYHYRTLGQKEGRTPPNLMGSPYTQQFFSKGGEASTEDFIKKQVGGDVSRETASPETRGVSSLKGYGEGEEAASIRRSAHEALRGLMGMRPYEETNPSEAYRIASTATPLTMIGGGIRGMKKIAGSEEAAKAIGKAAEAAGMKAPVTAAKSLTTLDDFHLSLGDQIRKRSADMQNLIESTPFKYSIGDRVFTADSARKNRPPLEILNRVMVGNDPMREGHPILGKVIKDPETGKTKRTPYEPGYEVLLFEGKDNWTKFRIPESAIKGMIDPIEPLEKQNGGEASTEEFIKKNVSRGTSEVPQLDTEGRLIDEREEIRSESQRMLNRLQSQPSKLPPGIRRTVAATREQGKESMFPAAAPARDLLSGILGASPTAPGSQAYRTGQAIANMPPVQAAAAIPAKIAASAGDAATALAAMGPALAGAVRPYGKGTVFSGVKLANDWSVGSSLDNYIDQGKSAAFSVPDVDKADAIQKFFDTKARRYMSTQLGTQKDPVFNAIKEGQISNLTLHDIPGLRKYAIAAAKEGKFKTDKKTGEFVLNQYGQRIFYPKDPQAVMDVTKAYDEMVDIKPMSFKPGLIPKAYSTKDPLYEAEFERVREQMRQALEDEGLDSRLVNLTGDPMILTSARDTGEPYYPGFLYRMDDFIKDKLSGDPEAMKGVPENIRRALDQNELLYDVSVKQGVLKDILDPENMANYLSTLSPREIDKIRFEDAVVGSAKLNRENIDRKFEGLRIQELVKSGKAPDKVFSKGVSEPLLQFGEDQRHPGFAWKRLEDINATIPEGAYVGHSVGGYVLGGIGYGPKHTKGFLEGTHEIYSLRNGRNRPVTTIQIINEGSEDNPFRVVKQIKGNGVNTGNTAPVNYDEEVYDFLTQVVKPDAIEEKDQFLTPLLIQYRDALKANRQTR